MTATRPEPSSLCVNFLSWLVIWHRLWLGEGSTVQWKWSSPSPGSLKALLLQTLLEMYKTRGRKRCKWGTTRNFLHSFPLSGTPVVHSCWAWGDGSEAARQQDGHERAWGVFGDALFLSPPARSPTTWQLAWTIVRGKMDPHPQCFPKHTSCVTPSFVWITKRAQWCDPPLWGHPDELIKTEYVRAAVHGTT